MGTRNITSVILNGKQMVCQYGQWDGYPSYTGIQIMEFLRDHDLSQFRKALENTKITVTAFDDATTYTGSTKEIEHLSQKVFDTQSKLNAKNPDGYTDWFTAIQHMRDTGTLSQQEYYDYLTSTRDTGCKILDVIYDHPLDNAPLELFSITEEFDGNYSFDIQGIYVLDLDNNTLKMTYDGYSHTYDIHALPENIHLDMLVFENITRKLYSMDRRAPDLSSLSPEALEEKAAKIALSIGKDIQKDYAELLADPEQPLDASMFGKDLILGFLSDKAMQQRTASKSFADLIANAAVQAAAPTAVPDKTTPQPEPDRS